VGECWKTAVQAGCLPLFAAECQGGLSCNLALVKRGAGEQETPKPLHLLLL